LEVSPIGFASHIGVSPSCGFFPCLVGETRTMLASRRMAWGVGWQAIRQAPELAEATASASSEHQWRIGQSGAGAVVAQHEGVWTPQGQKGVLREVRLHLLSQPTQHMHTKSIEGVSNMLLVLRFLHDLESRLEHFEEGSGSDADESCMWSARELFCRPWVLANTAGPILLRLEEHVPPTLRTLCALCSPWGVPLGSLLAWVTLQSPSAFCRLHARRIVGPRIAPCCVQLGVNNYQIEARGLGLEALAEAARSPAGVHELVKGTLPQLTPRSRLQTTE